jgi:hypothetical protein
MELQSQLRPLISLNSFTNNLKRLAQHFVSRDRATHQSGAGDITTGTI